MTVEERVEKLENALARAKRRSRMLLAGVLVAGAVGVIVASLAGIPAEAAPDKGGVHKVVRAEKFEVVDQKGKTRAILAAYKPGPALMLYDEDGKERAGLAVGDNGPRLVFWDEKGKARTGLVAQKGGPALELYDAKGTLRAGMALEKGEPAVMLYDAKGTLRAGMAAIKDGPGLALWDEKRKTRVVLGAIQTETADGRVISYPESSLLLFGPDGKIIWTAP